MLWVEVNWSLCTATPSTQIKKWKGFLFPNFFLREWGGYSVARKTTSFFFFTIKVNFKAPCKCCPTLAYKSSSNFSWARSPRGRFFMFSAEKASERARALRPTTGTGKEKRRTLRKSNDAPANYWSIDWSIPFLSYYSFKSKEWRMSIFSQNHQYIIKTKGYENWKHDHQWGNALIVYEKKKNYQLIL